MMESEARAWQRPLKGNRLETFVAVSGMVMHLNADVVTTDGMLALLEEHVREPLPPIERRRPLYGRLRPPKQIAGQLSFDEAA